MHRWFALLLLVLSCCAAVRASDDPLRNLTVLSYHDVREVRSDGLDTYTIEAAELINHFAWLREHGYTPVSLQQVVDAGRGGKPLPAKPVLLTFDDGYRSFYTLVYPLLKLFEYPALLAVVGRWIDDPVTGVTAAPTHTALLSWDEIRAMVASGQVELASHSYDLHRGVLANAQGNEQAAATTRRYDTASARHESDAAYTARVRADLAHSVMLIERETGRRPRAMVWPYGAYNIDSERIARELGMGVSVTLDRRSALGTPGVRLGRVLIQGNPTMLQFAAEMLRPYPPTLIRGAHIDLDAVFDADPTRQEENLSRLLDRVAALGLNTVYLSAFHDAGADGIVDAAYFPTTKLPVRADLLGRVAWQLHTRAGVQVYAWLPLFGLDAVRGGSSMTSLDPSARGRITALFEDLGRHAAIDGLLFKDDPSAGEDAAYDAFVQDILRAIAKHRAPLATARSLPLRTAVETAAGERPSPALIAAMATHDQVLLRAAPASTSQQRWLGRFNRNLPAAPVGRGAVVFDLPADHRDIAGILYALQLQGIGNLSYGPDDFRRGRPSLDALRPVISGQSEAK